MKKSTFYPYLELFIGLSCISTSGPLGRYITLAPELTILSRSLIAVIFIFLLTRIIKVTLEFNWKKHGKTMLVSSILLAVHLVTYFYSLQYSGVAIGMLSLFTFPIMTSFLEPLILKSKFQPSQILMGLLVIVGLYFLVPTESDNQDISLGILFGLGSAFAFSLRNILVKSLTCHYGGQTIIFYQMGITLICLLPFLAVRDIEPVKEFWPYLILLGILTTAIGHTLFARAFKNFSATTTSILSGLQPILGIILGVVFLSEIPGYRTIIGGAIIMSTVIIEAKTSYNKVQK